VHGFDFVMLLTYQVVHGPMKLGGLNYGARCRWNHVSS